MEFNQLDYFPCAHSFIFTAHAQLFIGNFFWCSCDCNLQMNRPGVFIVSVLRDKNNWARTSQGNRKNRTEFSTVLDQKKRWISLCGGWREVGVLVLPRSNAFQFNAARSSEACQVAGAAGGYGGAERER